MYGAGVGFGRRVNWGDESINHGGLKEELRGNEGRLTKLHHVQNWESLKNVVTGRTYPQSIGAMPLAMAEKYSKQPAILTASN